MRVLFNTYPVAFDCPGGGEIQLLKSREALVEAGVEVLLFDPWHPQFDRVDVVHYFSVQGGSSAFCGHVKGRGLPLLISPILWLTEDGMSQMDTGEIGHLLHICDLILPNSAAEAGQLSTHFGLNPEKFVVILNAIDPSFGETAPENCFREHFGIDGPFVLNVANIEPRKNQLSLIRALKGLDVELIILGNIRYASYYEQCMREGEGFVRHLGYLDHQGDLLKAAYRACTVFALPSTLETPSLAALEAAASGAKVVITGEGSAREYFGELVTYVNPLDVTDIRNGIVSALGSPKGSSQLKGHVLSNFTWARTAKQLVQAYRRACPDT